MSHVEWTWSISSLNATLGYMLIISMLVIPSCLELLLNKHPTTCNMIPSFVSLISFPSNASIGLRLFFHGAIHGAFLPRCVLPRSRFLGDGEAIDA